VSAWTPRLITSPLRGEGAGLGAARTVSLWAGFALALALFSAPALADPVPRPPDVPTAITVEAERLDSFDARAPELVRFGAVDFLGGLVLKSADKRFGGFSAMRMLDGERFVAVSDRAHWLTGRIVYAGDHPAGITDAVIAPILAADGRPITEHGAYDTESLTADGGTVYVGIERVHQLMRFDFGRDGVRARGQVVPAPADVASLPANKGLEALAYAPSGHPLAGTLIAISERGLDSARNIKGWLIGGAAPGAFTIRRTDDFDVSDCALLPSGDLLLLERRFSWTAGVAIRLRRIAANSIRPGVLLDGPVLLFADMGYQVDNMEALGVHRDAAGNVVLTLMSDDNFSFLQRTLVLQFRLVGE